MGCYRGMLVGNEGGWGTFIKKKIIIFSSLVSLVNLAKSTFEVNNITLESVYSIHYDEDRLTIDTRLKTLNTIYIYFL